MFYMASFFILITGCKKNDTKPLPTPGTASDIDGNVYHTATIGTQVWMVENLRTTKYRDGTPIPNVTDTATWIHLTSGAYCSYNNASNNFDIYGGLYNWYAATSIHNICPKGWHVPSDSEWKVLITFLGGDSIAGGKLKEKGTVNWEDPNTGATNESGFSARPGGCRDADGFDNYDGGNVLAFFWSSSAYDTNNAWERSVRFCAVDVLRFNFNKNNGFAIRCVKD